MDSSTITPVGSTKKSQKNIKVQCRSTPSFSAINTESLDDFNDSITHIPLKFTKTRALIGVKNTNDRNNHISKSRQYVIGDEIILPSWSSQSMLVYASTIQSNGPKSLKQHAIHAFSHNKDTLCIKKQYTKLALIDTVDKPHSVLPMILLKIAA